MKKLSLLKYFEIQVAPNHQDELKNVEKQHEKAKSLGYNFRVVTINKPINPANAIGWLNQALSNYFRRKSWSFAVNFCVEVNNPPKILQSVTYHAHLNQVKTDTQSIDFEAHFKWVGCKSFCAQKLLRRLGNG
jgi:hypothetical protein